jgi:Ca2+-binding RTX toxin-like protein
MFAAGARFAFLEIATRHTPRVEGAERFSLALAATEDGTAAGAARRVSVTIRDAEIRGTPAAEVLEGSRFDDRIFGGAGRDTIRGGAGDDRIEGGRGGDVLFGGEGDDVFVFRSAADSGPRPAQRDVIRDYEKFVFGIGGDRIDLSGFDADPSAPGRQSFISASFATFTAPRQMRIETVGEDTLVLLNTDRDAAPEAAILIRGVTGLTTFDDFIF